MKRHLAVVLALSLSGFLLGAKGDAAPKSKLNQLTQVPRGEWAAVCMERKMGRSVRLSRDTFGESVLYVSYDDRKMTFLIEMHGPLADKDKDEKQIWVALDYLAEQLSYRGLGCLPDSEMKHVMKTTEIAYLNRATGKGLIGGPATWVRSMAETRKK